MAMRSSGTKRTIASRSFSGHEGQPETCRRHPLTCCRGSSGMVSLTLRASLTLVAHRDRVLSFLLAVPPSHPPSHLLQCPRPLYPSWHESCSGKCVQYATAEELPCSLMHPRTISWGNTRAACYPYFKRRRGKAPHSRGNCIHANCIVASL